MHVLSHLAVVLDHIEFFDLDAVSPNFAVPNDLFWGEGIHDPFRDPFSVLSRGAHQTIRLALATN